HRLPGLLLILDFAGNRLATEGVVLANRGGRMTTRRRSNGAGNQHAWSGKRPVHLLSESGDVWQRIACRADSRNPMADEAGHDLWQSGLLVVSQRCLIDNPGRDQQMH